MSTENGQNGTTSPLRWLLVAVPLAVIGIAGSELLTKWVASLQRAEPERAAQEEIERAAEPRDEARGVQWPEIAPESAPPAAPAPFDAAAVIARLPGADLREGAATFRMCGACHVAAPGAPATIGPNLWGVAGRKKAAQAGYRYSAALSAKGGAWTNLELAEFLHNPRAFVPGTSMTFRGIESGARTANLIAYLGTLSDKSAAPPD